MGRPTSVSPKAYLRSLLGYNPLLPFSHPLLRYTPPFDRHDWVINSNGKEVRYVIDFYTGDENSPLSPPRSLPTNPSDPPASAPPSRPLGEKAHIAMHLDVRPALDSPGALFWRLKFSAFKIVQKYASLLPFSLPSFPKPSPKGPTGKGEETKND
jgi:hypothetical protein